MCFWNKYNNFIQAIENCKKVKLDAFVFALGIDGIGLGGSKNLCKHFNNDISEIMSAKKNELLLVKDFGPIASDNVYSYFMDNDNWIQVSELLKHIEIIKEEKKEVLNVEENPFKGAHVYPSGVFSMKKAELKIKLEEIGAIVESGYKKSLDMLICGGDMSKSGKALKAEKDGVKMVSEEFLMQYLK